MFFYERDHPNSIDYFKAQIRCHCTYPLHLHHCFEMIVSLTGETIIMISEQKYLLSANEAIVIFPNQIHSIEEKQANQLLVLTFAPELISDFFSKYRNSLPIKQSFPTMSFHPDILSLNGGDIFLQKAFLYHLCGEYGEEIHRHPCGCVSCGTKDTRLLTAILLYLNETYCGACSVKGAAGKLGYHATYLSAFFRQHMGMTFGRYLSLLRISLACRQLRETDKTVIEIGMECGYMTLRSFNRNFLAVTGLSPTAYRKQEG